MAIHDERDVGARAARGRPEDFSSSYTAYSTPELLKALRDEMQALARAEAESAKGELKQQGRKAAMGGGMLGAGAVVGGVGLIWLVGAAVYALALALPLWASALIIGGGLALIGAAVAWAGASSMKHLKPEKTIKHFEEDQQWLKGTLQNALATRRESASA
jgi:hypothetical protein